MRSTRVRTTMRRLSAPLAVVVALSYLLRPYPVGSPDGDTVVAWSDGTETFHETVQDAPRVYLKSLGPFVWVFWSDGSTSLHLKTHRGRVKYME